MKKIYTLYYEHLVLSALYLSLRDHETKKITLAELKAYKALLARRFKSHDLRVLINAGPKDRKRLEELYKNIIETEGDKTHLEYQIKPSINRQELSTLIERNLDSSLIDIILEQNILEEAKRSLIPKKG